MILLRSFVFAFSMFSSLPVPTLEWRDDTRRLILAMFPFVGAAVGVFIWGWLLLSEALGFGVLLRAAGLTLVPVAVTGGIHLDGFCDTVDALSSHAEPARKREILKDPHTGAFAVIGVVCYMIAYFALSAELAVTTTTPILLGLMFVVSRSLSGLSVLTLPSSAGDGTAATFRASALKTVSIVILLVIFAAAAVYLFMTSVLTGAVMIASALVCVLYLAFVARRQFGGMSGDLAGYFLQISELVMLAAIVIVNKVVAA